jgi:monoamine oxidase
MSKQEADFCVIGAGFAGLTAAYRLKQAGHSVVLLEARDRVGGRVWTKYLEDGTPVDMGGTFLGPGHDRVRQLLKEMGCETTKTPHEGDSQLQYQGKLHRYSGLLPMNLGIISLASVWASMKMIDEMSRRIQPDAPWNATKAKEWDSITVEQWLDNPLHSLTDASKTMLRALLEGLFTCDMSELSLLHLLSHVAGANNSLEFHLAMEGGAEQDMVKGGMQTIATKVAEKLGSSLQLESPVRKIVQDNEGVEVFSDKTVVRAKRVIVAVPTNLIDHIQFDPALPITRAELVRHMPAGQIHKSVLIYDEPFWRSDGLSGECAAIDHPISMSLDTTPPSGKPGSISFFAFAKHALHLNELSTEDRKREFIEAAVIRLGQKAATPTHYIEHYWSSDPWSRGGAMAHHAPGVLTMYGHVIREPFGRIHWAATETSPQWNGFIDGAVRSGERTAKEVIDAKEVATVR